MISTVLLCIWATWIEPTKELSGFFQYFRLDYSWGSNRGYAWHWAILMFINGSLKIKLFGAGPDTAYLMYISNYKNEMDANLPYYFKSPHNEYLNYLVTVGLVGLFAYMAIVITAVKKSFLRIKEDENSGVKWIDINEINNVIDEPKMEPIYDKMNKKIVEENL